MLLGDKVIGAIVRRTSRTEGVRREACCAY
jgi:hypothetical protein